MTHIFESVKSLFTPVLPLPPGISHYQAPQDSPTPYRLHLRLEPDGNGILIINASTILHLNPTAAELAYHLVRQTPEDQMLREIKKRYRVNRQNALLDYRNLKEKIQILIETPDLDPEMFLDFDRATPYSQAISAPFRLDCAITYQLGDSTTAIYSPTKRVERELTKEEWFGIFDKAWSYGIPHIILTGGEPTLRDDLFDLIAHLESNGQVAGLLSNGLKLVDDIYLQTLLQTGLDHLMLTISPESTESWNALECVIQADLFVVTHLTLTLQNAITTTQTLERMAKMGVKSLSLSASDPALQNFLIQYRDQAAALGLSLVWDIPVPYSAFNPVALETQVDNPPPGAGHAWLYIEPDGDVLPTQGVNQVLGNALSDSWEAFWR